MKISSLLAVVAAAALAALGSESSFADNLKKIPQKPEPPPEPVAPRGPSGKIRPERELLITDVNVVDSEAARYPGPLSFGGICERMAGAKEAPSMVREWLFTWMKEQKVGDSSIPTRAAIREQIILPWQEKDGYWPEDSGEWMPNLRNAPFRLLAVVNRMDMAGNQLIRGATASTGGFSGGRQLPDRVASVQLVDENGNTPAYYGADQLLLAGEGRLVFCALDAAGHPLPGAFTVIFEFPLPLDSERSPRSLTSPEVSDSLRQWAQQWHELAGFERFDSGYLATLGKIVDRFSTLKDQKITNPPTSLMRVRTSEKSFGAIREMREFDYKANRLVPASIKQTPLPQFADPRRDEHKLMAEYLKLNSEAFVAGRQLFPVAFNLRPMSYHNQSAIKDGGIPIPVAGGFCHVPDSASFTWRFNGVNDKVNRQFSIQTCNGCHCGDTRTPDGLHIKPREAGQPAALSAFLQPGKLSVSYATPGSAAPTVVELKEMSDRAAILDAFLEPSETKRNQALAILSRHRFQRSH